MSRRVAVVGGGAAGTLAAVHLLRDADAEGVEVTLIDRDGEFGPGVAYATPDPMHLLNVPAIRMGGIAGEPAHFHAWLADRGHSASPEAFVPRGVFGEYLRDLLRGAEELAGGTTRLDRVQADVVGHHLRRRGLSVRELRLAVQGVAPGDDLVAHLRRSLVEAGVKAVGRDGLAGWLVRRETLAARQADATHRNLLKVVPKEASDRVRRPVAA